MSPDLPQASFQNAANPRYLRISLLPIFLVHGFAHGRDWFSSVAGIGTRSVNLVAEPRPVRQTIGAGEIAFGKNEFAVQGFE